MNSNKYKTGKLLKLTKNGLKSCWCIQQKE